MNTDKAINIIEAALDMRFSDEQINILNQPKDKALLVNACAGSGKTTLFISNILVEELSQKQRANQVLGITFSRNARADMEERYDLFSKRIIDKYPDLGLKIGRPSFSTFHALFLSLLRTIPKYSDIKVLSGWQSYYLELAKSFTLDSTITDKTKADYLSDIFNTYDYLINLGYSHNGLELNYSAPYIKAIATKGNETLQDLFPLISNQQFDSNFLSNYTKVITKYNNLKEANNVIDFNDMIILLFLELRNKSTLQSLQKIMSKYQRIYIDEFQDINSLQWIIIKNLISTEVLNDIFVVGDDDQSIYGFRGSSSYYITNFKKKFVPSAEVMDLSTNYRTGENILNCAVPMIERNKSRLGKNLEADKKGKGKVKFISTTDSFIKNNFLNQLLQTVKESKYTGKTVGILCRSNFYKMLIRDYLAGNGIYTTSNLSVLQNNKLYKNFANLMDAITTRNASEFIKHSNVIGFSSLRYAFNQLAKTIDDTEYKDLYAFIQYCYENAYSLNLSQYQKSGIKKDIGKVLTQLRSYYNSANKKTKKIGFLWNTVKKLTYSYYKYMLDKKYINSSNYHMMVNYFDYLSKKADKNKYDYNVFNKSEENKTRELMQNSTNFANVDLITIHQAKGLEYDKVFIADFVKNDLDKNSINLEEQYGTDLNYVGFSNELNELAERKDKKLLHKLAILANGGVDYAEKLLHELVPKYAITNLVNNLKQENFRKKLPQLSPKYSIFPLSEKDMHVLFHSLQVLITDVEEERRILYVSITRAKENCYIEKRTNEASPFLYELKLTSSAYKKDIELDLSSVPKTKRSKKSSHKMDVTQPHELPKSLIHDIEDAFNTMTLNK